MRSWTRFGVMLGGLAVLVSAFMPWMRGLRPMAVPMTFLVGAADRRTIVGLRAEQVPFVQSMCLLLVIIAVLAVIAGLFSVRPLAWLASLGGVAVVVLFYLQVLYEMGSMPSQDYGASVGSAGVLVVLICGLWPRAKTAAEGSWQQMPAANP